MAALPNIDFDDPGHRGLLGADAQTAASTVTTPLEWQPARYRPDANDT